MDELLTMVARGDHDAFDRFYREFFGFIFHVAYTIVRDHAQTEEVTQEIFLELWVTASRYDSSQGSGTQWVTMIARRRAVDRVRSSQAARNRDNVVAHQAMIPSEPDPAEHLLVRAEGRQVREAMTGLSPEQQALLEQAYIHGTTYRELGDMLGIPVNTVKSRVRLALAKLRTRMPH